MTAAIEADVLVVGAGSAGTVIAARLSEDPTTRVLVFEAGPDWGVGELPSGLRSASGSFRWDAYSIEPDYYWQGLTCERFDGDAAQRFLRGRGLGGSSTINGCYAIRPPLSEFDAWVQAGCAGWGPDAVLPYFVRLEDDRDFGTEPYHGAGGPIPIARLPESDWGTVDRAFRDAGLAAGHEWQPDHNAPHTEGLSPFAANIVGGERVTTNDAYLVPARARTNLRVLGNALVDRVLVEGERAIGVRARIAGEWREVRAETTIVCAGAPLTAAILQRSGIGPAEILRAAGVEQLVDLPVGMSMQDHAGVVMGLAVNDGARASKLGLRANCVLRWSSGYDGADDGDLVCCALNVDGNEGDAARPPGLLGVLNQAFSRGRVAIRSSDPDQPPSILQNLLSDRRDVERFRLLFRSMLELLGQPSFTSVVNSVFDATGAQIRPEMSTSDLDAWARLVVRDTAHIVGTCRMGDPDDLTTVVDPECRVLGVDGLRVADASIFPCVPRANSHLTVLMAAERTADLLRDGSAMATDATLVGRDEAPQQS